MPKEKIEYKGEKFSIRWEPDEEILYVTMWGTHTLKDAQEYKSKWEEVCKKVPGNKPFDILTDVSKQEKSERDAQSVYTEVSKHPRSGRSAICGANVLVKLIVTTISFATHRKNIKVFSTVQQGLEWLKKEKSK